MQVESFTSEQRTFIHRYSKHIESGDAALFAGAGLSLGAGFVGWKGLLEDVAKELELDVNREPDLVALAQYYVNHRQSRSVLSETILDHFLKRARLTRNHYLLARLPIQTIWTTNYDQLIERAFDEAGKVVDVKLENEDFALQQAKDLVLYKMHGDAKRPHKAVLTKDDYERYEKEHPLFIDHLKMDLVTKTFLFLGFSFTDPNLEFVLARVRVLLGTHVRQHFAIIREPEGLDPYERRRLGFWKVDLQRFGISTVSVKEYAEIEKLLAAISISVNRKNVFVSGSFMEFSKDSPAIRSDSEKLGLLLGRKLIEAGCNLVSGFGVGVGEQCVLGALRTLYAVNDDARKRVVVRPFPTSAVEEEEQRQQNTRTRRDMISRAAAVVFIEGSQVDNEGKIHPSRGVLEEFKIAKEMQRFIIPIAATGHAAELIWKEVMEDLHGFYPEADVREQLERLADRSRSLEELADSVVAMILMLAKVREN